jgi:hypothetical protein
LISVFDLESPSTHSHLAACFYAQLSVLAFQDSFAPPSLN